MFEWEIKHWIYVEMSVSFHSFFLNLKGFESNRFICVIYSSTVRLLLRLSSRSPSRSFGWIPFNIGIIMTIWLRRCWNSSKISNYYPVNDWLWTWIQFSSLWVLSSQHKWMIKRLNVSSLGHLLCTRSSAGSFIRVTSDSGWNELNVSGTYADWE